MTGAAAAPGPVGGVQDGIRVADAFARGPAVLFWAQLLGNAGLFVALVVIARGLGPAGRGTIAFIAVAAILSARVTRLGVSDAAIVFAAQRPHLRPSLLTNLVLSVTAAAVLAAGVVSAVLLAVPSWRPSGIGDAELAILAVGILASALVDAGYSFVLGCSRFELHAVITVAAGWLYALAVAVVWVTMDLTVARVALIWVAIQGVKALVLLWASARASGVGRPDRGLLRESIGFGIRAWVGSLSDALNDRIDQILIAFIATEATLGVYAVAVNAWEILLYLPGAAATAVLPSVARANRTLRVEQVLKAFRSVAIVTVSGLAVAAAAGPLLLVLVFGAPFEASIGPFLWLLPGTLGYVALSIFSSALVGSSSPGLSSLGPLVSLGLGVALDVILIPSFGAEGAAIAASAALLAGGATALILYRTRASFALGALIRPRPGDLDVLKALVGLFSRRPRLRRA
ncbi:MAG TPA: oligosaccharide flippase family protein [Gaiellaceae bacterium]|nr:oligosaccharide flippase family protein [Gaiellaceae bacterium]